MPWRGLFLVFFFFFLPAVCCLPEQPGGKERERCGSKSAPGLKHREHRALLARDCGQGAHRGGCQGFWGVLQRFGQALAAAAGFAPKKQRERWKRAREDGEKPLGDGKGAGGRGRTSRSSVMLAGVRDV